MPKARLRTSVLLLITGVLLPLAPNQSASADTAVSLDRVHVVTSTAGVIVAPYDIDLAAVQAQLVPLTTLQALQLTATVPLLSGMPLETRVVAPTATTLYVVDDYWSSANSQFTSVMYTVDRLSGAAALSSTTVGSRNGTNYTATTTGPAGNPAVATAQATAIPAAGCEHCFAAETAFAIWGQFACFAAALSPYASLGCGLFFVAAGVGVHLVCETSSCGSSFHGQQGLALENITCEFGSCAIAAGVATRSGTSLMSLGDTAYWIYAPRTSAQLDSGGYASEYGDNGSAFVYQPTAQQSQSSEYRWTHYGSQTRWTPCSTTVQISVTAQWSDYSFVSTGYVTNNKLFSNGCPGFRVS